MTEVTGYLLRNAYADFEPPKGGFATVARGFHHCERVVVAIYQVSSIHSCSMVDGAPTKRWRFFVFLLDEQVQEFVIGIGSP